MKLPEMPDIEELEKGGNHGKLNCLQLAQLHCLRSIAVNLEVIGDALLLDIDGDENEEIKIVMSKCMKIHSVMP